MQFSSDSNVVTGSSSQTESLPSSPIESILPTATPSIAGTKKGTVPKRRFQKGTLVKRYGNWAGMRRVDSVQPDAQDGNSVAKRFSDYPNRRLERSFNRSWMPSTPQTM